MVWRWASVLIVLIAAALVGAQLLSGCRYTRHRLGESQIRHLAETLLAYHGETGCLPDALAELTGALPAGRWLRTSSLVDPWRKPWYYRRDEQGFGLLSLGADGRIGGEDEDADFSVEADTLVRAVREDPR